MIDARKSNKIITTVATRIFNELLFSNPGATRPSFTEIHVRVSRDWGVLSLNEFYEKYKEVLQ